MLTHLLVLTEDEQNQVHERSLEILARTGVRVDSEKDHRLLAAAGAEVDESSRIVRFPRNLIETSLALAPKSFTLGARRPGWDKPMNAGDCTLLMDGEGTMVVDRNTETHRPATFHWKNGRPPADRISWTRPAGRWTGSWRHINRCRWMKKSTVNWTGSEKKRPTAWSSKQFHEHSDELFIDV